MDTYGIGPMCSRRANTKSYVSGKFRRRIGSLSRTICDLLVLSHVHGKKTPSGVALVFKGYESVRNTYLFSSRTHGTAGIFV